MASSNTPHLAEPGRSLKVKGTMALNDLAEDFAAARDAVG
jgi:hypothetical protein